MNIYKHNIELKPYNSFRTSAIAKHFFEPKSLDELQQAIKDFESEPKLIIGGGCNIFFTKNFEGLVIRPQLYGITVTEKANTVTVEAMASENWDDFVEFCVSRQYAGLENLSLIPGTVGASPVQNIGAYGSEVKDTIEKVTALDIYTNELVEFNNEQCEFGYRSSFFKTHNNYIIISVTFTLSKEFSYTPKYTELNNHLAKIAAPTIQDVRSAVIEIRKDKLPDEKLLPNAGSFFKNPYLSKTQAELLKDKLPDLPLYPIDGNTFKTSAAYLIDRAGLKGERIGHIGTYPKQALIIVNYGSSNGNDIIAFMQMIQNKIADLFDIKLEPEVRIF